MGEFLGYTVGLTVTTGSRGITPVLAKAEYTRNNDGSVTICAVSGHNMSKVRNVKPVTISAEEYTDRPINPYNSTREAVWALSLLKLHV